MLFSEENVLAELKKRNPESLEYIMNLYGKDVYTLVGNILKGTGSREDIEECVSEVFVQVWDRCESFRSDRGSLRTWILILAKYKALDFRRNSSKTVNSVSTEEIELVSHESVEKNVIGREEKKQIIAAINSLNDIDREIFLKRYFYYESIDDIAKYFGLTREAIDNRLWRGRKRIREYLGSLLGRGVEAI